MNFATKALTIDTIKAELTGARLTVLLVPPSVNHYVKHTRSGRHYETSDASSFRDAVKYAWHAAGRPVIVAKRYSVEILIYLGAKKKGDVDNFAKCVLDGITKCGLIKSDAKITDLILRKRRDRENPRTEITVTAL